MACSGFWWFVGVYGDLWGFIVVYGELWWYLVIYDGPRYFVVAGEYTIHSR